MANKFFPGVFAAVLLAGTTAFSQEALTNLAAVRELPLARAAEGLPVQLEATVTYVDLPQNGIFIHDGREGIYVKDLPANAAVKDLLPGLRLLIHAHTHQGDFIPRLTCDLFEILGTGPMPKPVLVNDENLFSPALDCQWVKVTGVIIGTESVVERQLVLVMQLYGWTIKLLLPANDDLVRQAAKLMQRRVTFEGVAATVFNAQRQMTGRYFSIPSMDFIQTVDKASQTGPAPLMAVDQLLRSDATTKSWVRLRGVVTQDSRHGLFLRGDGGSLKVLMADGGEFIPGDQVEVEGFAAITPFRPELRAIRVTLMAKEAPPKPVWLSAENNNLASLQGELIEVKAEYLGQRNNPNAVVLQCQTGDRFFEVLMPKGVAQYEDLIPGATVRLVGICELSTTHPLPRTLWVDGFRLLLQTPDDLTILSRPSWWTAGRLLAVLALVVALALAAGFWAWTLRRRVLAQTEIIGAQIEREAILSERRRLARDFHDTLEQEMTGVAMQLDNAEKWFGEAPDKSHDALKLAKKMLHFSRGAARTSISDLRSAVLIEGDLAGVLNETLPPLAAECAAEFVFKVTGTPWRMDVVVENHLLRMAREALINAVHHSGAAHISVELAFDAKCVQLSVRDNGRGFDPTARPPRGHFGVIGLRERANITGATLKLVSAPGAGTTVNVTLSAERAKQKLTK